MPFASQKPQLLLDDETRAWLHSVSVSRTAPAAQVERAGMLLAFIEGESVSAIARRFHTNRVKVNDTIGRSRSAHAPPSEICRAPDGRGRSPTMRVRG